MLSDIGVILVSALVLYLTSRAIFSAYFRAREEYWVRFYQKRKESEDGKS